MLIYALITWFLLTNGDLHVEGYFQNYKLCQVAATNYMVSHKNKMKVLCIAVQADID